MRILDKNNDYYDYHQDYADNMHVFDRRGSKLFSKEDFCMMLKWAYYYDQSKYRFVLFQCGATFWLFLATITKRDTYEVLDYDLELLTTWKNYNAKRKVLSIQNITFSNYFVHRDFRTKDFLYEDIIKHVNDYKNAIINNEYCNDIGEKIKDLEKRGKNNGPSTYPLLRACGIAQLIDSQDVYQAIDEHFSLIKTESEKTEAIGTTNNDKIVMHGFDTKTSFRGKV